MSKQTLVSVINRVLLPLLVAGMVISLVGCGRLEAGIEPTPTALTAAIVTRPPELTPIPDEPLPIETNISTPMPIQQVPSGLVYQTEGVISIWEAKAEKAQTVLNVPSGTGHLTFSSTGNVAYTLEDNLYLGKLLAGQARQVYNAAGRAATDWILCWSTDGSTLAYALAWDEADGSRQVELGTTDGYDQRVVATIQARAAGPTPTPPSAPSAPLEPGFANLAILGFDRITGQIVVMPVGAQESKQAIWVYDVRSGDRIVEAPWPTEYISMLTPVPVLSSDLSHLAAIVPGTPTQPAALHVLAISHLNEPEARIELPAETHATWLTWSPDSQQLAYSLNEGSTPGLDASPSLGAWVWQWKGDRPRQLTSLISPELTLHGWTSDSHAIVLETLDGVSRQWSTMLVRASDTRVLSVHTPENAVVLGWLGPAPTGNWVEIQDVPEPAAEGGEPVDGWAGIIIKLEPGNQFGRYFQREDGERYDISSKSSVANTQIDEAQRTGATIRVWGRAFYGIPADQARHIEVERIEIASGPATSPRNLSPLAQPSASSVLPADEGGTYAAQNSIDGQVATAWVEGVDGPGQGQWLMLTFPTPVTVCKLGIDVGFDHTSATFVANNRLKKATAIFSNGKQIQLEFADARGVQVQEIEPVSTTYVQIVIDEVYPGSQYDDTCLAEVEVWGIVQ